MSSRKNTEKIAKMLLKKSLAQDETIDAKKVRLNLSILARQKPPQLINILKIYKKLIANNLSREELIVETSQKLSNQRKFEKDILAKTGAQRINYKINPGIIVGAKITHGDWIYDETLQAKLAQLTTDD